jgi:hypothetical protein
MNKTCVRNKDIMNSVVYITTLAGIEETSSKQLKDKK